MRGIKQALGIFHAQGASNRATEQAQSKETTMAISTEQLERMSQKLHTLKERLAHREKPADAAIAMDDPLVAMARECEFPLPRTLTGRTLAEEVERKIANVEVLMARAREHEALPPEMRSAADQENSYMVEDYKDGGVADTGDQDAERR